MTALPCSPASASFTVGLSTSCLSTLVSGMKRESLRMGLPAKPTMPEAMRLLIDYAWDGNIRELENIARYLLVVVDSDIIEPQDLPFFYDLGRDLAPVSAPATGEPQAPAFPTAPAPGRDLAFGERTWEQVEKAYVRYLLEQYDGNVTRAAKAAAINRSTFASRMRKLGITKA
jgi:DNA-binding NtrC family response regulator